MQCPGSWVRAFAATAVLSFGAHLRVVAQAPNPSEEPSPLAAGADPRGMSGSVADSNYRMRSGDTVRVSVFGEPELTVEGRLDAQGRLQCALIGQMILTDLTVVEAAQRIEAAYRQDYLVQPQVTVAVLQFSRRTVTVLGQVARPGAYDMPESGQMNILQVLGMAGGTTRIARLSKVKIRRRGRGGEEVLTVDVSKHLNGQEKQPFLVREGDVITVPESWF